MRVRDIRVLAVEAYRNGGFETRRGVVVLRCPHCASAELDIYYVGGVGTCADAFFGGEPEDIVVCRKCEASIIRHDVDGEEAPWPPLVFGNGTQV